MKIITGIFLLALLVPISNSNAQINLNERMDVRARVGVQADINQNARVEMNARIEAEKAEMLGARQEMRVRLGTAVKARVNTSFARVFSQIKTSINRLETLSARIENRIEAFSDRGVDMSASVDLLAKANASLSASKDDVASAEVAIKAELAKDEVSREEVLSIIQATRESIRETHKAFVDTIASIKASVNIESSTE